MNVTLFLTHQCNLRCDYCYNGAGSDRVMSSRVARQGVELALASPTAGPDEPVLIRFFGGEPLLQLDLLKTSVAHARYVAARETGDPCFSITTNGTLLDQPTAAYLEEQGFAVAVSYDGCQTSQDAHRRFADGSGSHEATLAGLQTALAELTTVECCATIEPDTVSHLAEALDELLGLGVPLATFTPDWEADWSEAHLTAFDLALGAFADRWLESYRTGQPMDVEPFDSKIRSHIGSGFPPQSRCPFGLGELAVAPSGRLYP